MEAELLLMKIARASDPFMEIDNLKEEFTVGFVEYLNQTAGGLAQQQDLMQAYVVNEWAVRIAQILGEPVMQAHTYFNRSRLEMDLGKLDLAEESMRYAMRLYDEHGSTEDLLDGVAALIDILLAKGDTATIQTEAKLMRETLMSAAQLTGSIKEALQRISLALIKLGERSLARDFLDVLLQLAEQSGDQEGEAAACAMLAETFVDEDNTEAVRRFERALSLDRMNNDMTNLVSDLGNLGYLSYRQGSLEAAADYFTECIALREREGLTAGLDMDVYRYYHVCHYLGRRAEALQLFVRLNEIHTGAGGMKILSYHLNLDERGEKMEIIPFVIP